MLLDNQILLIVSLPVLSHRIHTFINCCRNLEFTSIISIYASDVLPCFQIFNMHCLLQLCIVSSPSHTIHCSLSTALPYQLPYLTSIHHTSFAVLCQHTGHTLFNINLYQIKERCKFSTPLKYHFSLTLAFYSSIYQER